MNEQFKVGEIAIGCNMETLDRNGMECEIRSPLHSFTAPRCDNGVMISDVGYVVKWSDGYESLQQASKLRKKRPPESDDATARQAMLDCIERERQPQSVDA